MNDLVVVGAGVVGLSAAYEAASRGAHVTILDKRQTFKSASSAGAGILVPTNEDTALHPLEKLRGMSSRLHEVWAERLLSETGIDNGYSKCGGLYVARTSGEVASLFGIMDEWREFEIRLDEISIEEWLVRVPTSSNLSEEQLPRRVFWAPDEAQIENRFHLKALRSGCEKLGVKFVSVANRVTIDSEHQKILSVQTEGQSLKAGAYCFCAGPWTEALLESHQISLPMVPVRGQMLLYKLPAQFFEPIIYEGARYIVPRRDGHVLVGSTVEEVGFDPRTTQPEIEGLQKFASSLIPDLDETTYVEAWAGLRPGTYDGFPYLGRIGGLENGFVSTGHLKSGLHMSTGSAVVIVDLIEGKSPAVNLTPFDPNRATATINNGC